MKTRSGLSVWVPKPPKVILSKNETTSKEDRAEHTEATADQVSLSVFTLEEAPDQPQQVDRKFTLFPKLPPELRNKIWELNIPSPRVVKIAHDPKDMTIVEEDEIDLEGGRNPWWRARVVAGPVPSLLHVNKEARSFLSQHYKLFFDKQTQGRPIYFDAARDTLFLSEIRAFYGRRMGYRFRKHQGGLEHMHDTEHGVRRLAICSTLIRRWDAEAEVLLRYSNLEQVDLLEPSAISATVHSTTRKYIEKLLAQAGSKVPHFDRISFVFRLDEGSFAVPKYTHGNYLREFAGTLSHPYRV